MKRGHRSSLGLRTLLILLIIMIFIPVLGVLLFTGYKQHQHVLADVENSATQLISLFIEEQRHIADQTRQFLKVLSHVPAVRNLDLVPCNAFLKAIHQENSQYSTIVAASAEGIIDCCAIPLKKSINVTDRSWFQRIHQSGAFVIDHFIISRAAKKASLPFAYPVYDAEGTLQVAVGAAFDLEYYHTIFEKIPLPRNSVIIVTDRNGTVLYQSFTQEKCLGKPLSQCRGFDIPEQPRGRFTVDDADGVTRICWFERLSVGQEDNEICLLIGISEQMIFAKSRQMLLTNISVLSVVAFLSLVIAWFFGGKFILNPVSFLLEKTRRVRKGNLRLSEETSILPGELAILSAAFDDMVINLSRRESERDQALSALQKARDELEDRVAERTLQLEAQTAELASAKEKAEAASRTKSEFLSNMSHELRTPLNAILGYAQILRQREELTRLQKDGLDIISESGDHLLTLINDILDISKIEAGKTEILPTDVYLPGFLNGIVGIIRTRAQKKDIAFTYEKPGDLPFGIQADETRLRQILLNLLGNAVKFTDKGAVTFSVSSVQEHETARICFEIEDTGVGMNPEELEKIFRAFEQVGDARYRSEGTGLGLSISQKLVRAMGGELHVRSELGKGSCFWFEICVPIVRPDALAESVSMRKIIGYASATEQPLKVLVADDKPHNRSLIVSFLEPLGFEMWEAQDGQEAVAQARAVRPDLIITDLVMPVMTGIEAVQEIRQTPEVSDVIIIAMSASVFQEDSTASIAAGCHAFLPKPVDMLSLSEQIATHLNLKWIYEDESEVTTRAGLSADDADVIPPPSEDLVILHDMARRGNLWEIREKAAQLERKDQRYKPFTDQLKQLASDYEELKIQMLIEKYMGVCDEKQRPAEQETDDSDH